MELKNNPDYPKIRFQGEENELTTKKFDHKIFSEYADLDYPS